MEPRRNLLLALLAVALVAVSCGAVLTLASEDSSAEMVADPTYTLTLHDDSGTNKDIPYTVSSAVKVRLPIYEFERDGYYLEYWTDGTTNYRSGSQVQLTEDTTFTTVWKQARGTQLDDVVGSPGKTVTFNPVDMVSLGTFDSFSYTASPSWIEEPAFPGTATGDFSGYTNDIGVYYFCFDISIVHYNPTYYWFRIIIEPEDYTLDDKFTVEFDTNGGTVDNADELNSLSKPVGTIITLPSPDSCHNYNNTLLGWAVMVNGVPMTAMGVCGQYTIDPDAAGVSEGEPITIEARWYAEQYGLIFNAFGSPGVTGDVAREGDNYKMVATTETQSGYTFAGWTEWNATDTVIPIDSLYTVEKGMQFFGYWLKDGTSTYHVTLDANGGSGTLNVDVKQGDKVQLPKAMPDRAGYTFVGWADESGKLIETETFTPSKATTTLKAQWTQNVNPVESITISGSSAVSVGSRISIQATAYLQFDEDEFPGDRRVYFEVADGDEDIIEITSSSTNSTGGSCRILGLSVGTATLVAYSADGNCTVEKTITVTAQTYVHTLTYDANGGMNAPYQAPVDTGTASSYTFAISEQEPTYEGYEFLGWATTRDGNPEYGWGENQKRTITVSGSQTLYARWQEKESLTHQIIYDANGGVWSDGETQDVVGTITTDESYEFGIRQDQPTRLGYLFMGWSEDKDAAPDSEDLLKSNDPLTVTGTKTLYAIWADNRSTYTLHYDANGGDEDSVPDDRVDKSSSTYYQMQVDFGTIPTRDGYTFLGWSVDKDAKFPEFTAGGNVTITFTAAASGAPAEKTVYAIWEVETFKHVLTFDDNGGSGGPGSLVSPETPEDSYEFTIPKLAPTYDEAHIFRGWSEDPNASPDSEGILASGDKVTVTKELTLYAVWEVMEDIYHFELVYNLDGGVGDGFDTQIYQGTESSYDFEITQLTPSKGKSAFLGWTTVEGSGIPVYGWRAGQLNEITADTENRVIILYAVWKESAEVTYTVAFHSEGGSSVQPQTVQSGGRAVEPRDPVRSGYQFTGWFTADGVAWDFSKAVTKDIDLYAHWYADGSVPVDPDDSGDDGGNDSMIWFAVMAVGALLFAVGIIMRVEMAAYVGIVCAVMGSAFLLLF